MGNVIIKLNDSDVKNSSKYILKNKDIELGYSYIFDSAPNNNVYVFIHPEHRSNGYGSYLFGEMLKIMKSLGSKAIKFDIEKTDVCANNILAKFKGLLLSEDENAHWILKL